jgi:hypothetical protein
MADLTTLAAVKEYLGQKDTATTDDALLSKLISRASAFIVTYANREFLSKAYTETRDGNGSNRLILKNQNVTAVASVTIDGEEIPAGGSSTKQGFWFSGRWVYLNGYRFSLGFGNVNIVYTAGFATVPADVEQVCIELVANKYKRKERIGEVSKNVNGMVVSYSTTDLSSDHREILDLYESVVPV